MKRWAFPLVAMLIAGCSGSDDGAGTPPVQQDAQAEAIAESGPEASQEEAATEAEGPDAGPDAQPEAEAGEDAPVEAAPDVVSDHPDEFEMDGSDAKLESEVTPEAEPEPQPEPQPEAGPDAVEEAAVEPQPEAGTEPQSEPQPEAGPEAGPEPAPEAGPDAPEDVHDASPEAEASIPCPSSGGAMVRLPSGFCIDTTEVTVAAYRACVTASKCAVPLSKPADSNWTAGNETHPLNWVRWSEAKAFCEANGKRLCGRIGGGSPGGNHLYEAAVDQWYNACSSGGANTYTYGGTYQAGACNTSDTEPVASYPTCHSPDPGYATVMDMSGNVWEWEDLCSGGLCLVRGGGNTTNPQTDLRCDFSAWRGASWAGKEVGFRCCAD